MFNIIPFPTKEQEEDFFMMEFDKYSFTKCETETEKSMLNSLTLLRRYLQCKIDENNKNLNKARLYFEMVLQLKRESKNA